MKSSKNFLGLTLLAPGCFGWCSTGGGGVPPPITPLSLKLDYSILYRISFIPTFDFFSNWLLSALDSICLPPFVLFSL